MLRLALPITYDLLCLQEISQICEKIEDRNEIKLDEDKKAEVKLSFFLTSLLYV